MNYNNNKTTYNDNNNGYKRSTYDVVVFCEDTKRKFFHKGLKKWEVEALRFNPHLKVKIVDRSFQNEKE